VSWYSPEPARAPLRSPRRRPIKTIPSGIGDQGIVGNWLMYYLKGGDHLHDFSPYKNHGTLKNDPVWKDGRYGWALDFDGEDDCVDVKKITGTPTAFTLSAWINPDSFGLSNHMLHSQNSGETECVWFRTEDDKKLYLYLKNDGGVVVNTTSSSTMEIGTWYHVVGVWDGSEIKVYIDGTQDGTPTSIDSIMTGPFEDPFIGSDVTIDRLFDGQIAIFRIYKVAKSSSWISKRYERTKGIFGK